MKRLVLAAAGFAILFPVFPVFAAEPAKVAFVDTGNTGRSVTAEASADAVIARRGLKIAVISRAIDMDPFDVHPEPNAAKLLADRGIDVSGHLARQMDANDARHADVILVMTEKHKTKVIDAFPDARAKVHTLAEFASGKPSDVPDAWGKPMEAYASVLRQLDEFVGPALDKAAAFAH